MGLAVSPAALPSPITWGEGEALENSPAVTAAHDFPTAGILNISFSLPVSGLSFTFDNCPACTDDNGASSFTAYSPTDTVIDNANISGDYGGFTTVTVVGSDITDLQITNGGTEGVGNWLFGVQELEFTPTPEPASMLLFGTGLLGVIFVLRNRLFV